ncbi:Ribosomal protein L11 methyltransferase (PrmA) [Nesidiocoris tenuis]|uniref:Ribosomal protein L11 methyltransferase (PrmA) n=1 Tax=Nesidiocoris tenuis TaxID=355587 RepID=A0ABN7AUK3_9HEMI|nr:Ribosomal protein L11 methyltransferase (PrmA) [Nesidiocoris tenuis]
MSASEALTNFSLEHVHASLAEGKPVRALGQLLVLVNLDPQSKAELCPLLLSLLGTLSSSLAVERRYDDLLKCYQQVLTVYSDNEVVLNNIGSQLYRFNHLIESRRYFRKACEINPSYLAAFRNWQNVTNVLVERWHFRMLNDTLRNETFRKAISKRVDENSTVIDIGTGTGLLSLYSSAAGAKFVCACDYSPVMISIARTVFAKNLKPDAVRLVNKLSTEMTVPDDIPYKCSLVVTETMDSGLLGEHLLSTLDHAWDRLLLEKESPSVPQVIPSAARLFATPIESSKIARRTGLLPMSQTDFEPLDWTDVKVRPVKYEPYDTENLFANAGHKYLSDPVEIFRFDFNNPKEIKDRLKTNTEERSEVLCTVSGQVDAIAVWFEANLDDELTITTSPLSPVHCNSWHHAVFPCRQPLVVEVGRRLRLVSRCDRGVLQVKLADERPAENAIPLDTSVIQFINCHSYLSMLDKALARILDSRPIESVIDVSHFPHQGLRMAKNSGARLMTVHPNLPGRLAKKLMKRNKIKSDQVFRKSFTDVERMGEAEAEEKYDLLIVHFVEPRGEISQEYIKIFEDISSRLLKPDCVVIPSKTEIWGRLVDSRQLVDENRVTNQCLNEDFHLGELINDFQVSTHLDVRIDELDFVPLSNEFLIGAIPTSEINSRFNLQWTVSVPCTSSGRINSILYWYNIFLYDDVVYSTDKSDSFANQAAEVLPCDVPVDKSQCAKVTCLYNFGVIKMEVST